jgi:2'-5' RNA ligase
VPAVCRVVSDVAGGLSPFEMTVAGAGCFPSARRPRTLWVGIGEGLQELVALHDALEPPLLDLGCYRREERQYTPHVTLGRVKGEAGADQLAAAITRRADWQGGRVAVREVLVMSSELGRDGPTYTVLGRGKLGG